MKSTIKQKTGKFLKSIQSRLSLFIENNLDITGSFFILLIVAIMLICLDIYQLDTTIIQGNILGLFFNILVFGILIVIINKRLENKRNIKRYKEEIDDYRGWCDPQATFRIVGNIRRLNRHGISKINLQSCFLKGALLWNVNLKETVLVMANLEGARLGSSNLERVRLTEANIGDASFYHANLQGAELSRVQGKAAHFDYANLSYANLAESNYSGAHFYHANLENAYLANSGLSRTDFTGANLRKADFHGVSLQEARLDYADFQEAILAGALVFGYKSYITTLHGASLEGANLNKVDFYNTDLMGADLRKANLVGAKNLTVDQLSKVKTLYQAMLDPSLEQQIKEMYPHLLERPKE